MIIYSDPWSCCVANSGPFGISLPYNPPSTLIQGNWIYGPATNYKSLTVAIEIGFTGKVNNNVIQYWTGGAMEEQSAQKGHCLPFESTVKQGIRTMAAGQIRQAVAF